jgi:hypothetical protein
VRARARYREPTVGGRRLIVLLLALGALAVPATALRAACVGASCAEDAATPRVPFCPLPDWMKTDLAAGYYEGRSPDVLGVANAPGLSQTPGAAPWPSVAAGSSSTAVPIAFWGAGVRPGPVRAGTTLDAIAPTIASAIGLRRPHPDVRSGVEVPGVVDANERPTLVVEIGLAGIGSADVHGRAEAWPSLLKLIRSGAGTVDGSTGSLPLDPTSTLTTIGTGGLPDQHGMTGTLIRNDAGRVVTAWERGSPPSIIATLPDDLDAATKNAAMIGLVAPTLADRGLIGGTWYPNTPPDDLDVLPTPTSDPLPGVESMLRRGFGADDVPDVIGVVLDGASQSADGRVGSIVRAAERSTGGRAMIVVAGTGGATGTTGGVPPLVAQVNDDVSGAGSVVAGVVPGGMFLDESVLAARRISGQTVVDALLGSTSTPGRPAFRDAFQGFAVSFARYC